MSLVTELERLADALGDSSAEAAPLAWGTIAERIAKNLNVKTEEVAILGLSALSFLGLGVQPPDADWGSMVRDYRDMINFGSAAPLYPAAAIAILTIGVNFVVDWMLSIHSRGQGEGA